MIYQYVAYNTKGEVVKGKLTADGDAAANDLLEYAGYNAITLKQYTPFFTSDFLTNQFSQVKPSDVILLFRQLAMLLESGTDIAASLDLLQQQVDSSRLKKVLAQIVSDVREGGQLSEGLEKHPKIFPDVYCKMISVGEQSGDLETVLRQVADYMEKSIATAKQTKGALMMPCITGTIAIIVILLMIMFILPSFSKMFDSMGVALPGAAQFLIDLGEVFKENALLIIAGILIAIIAVVAYVKTPRGRYNFDKLVLKIPVVGRIKHLSELARFCRSMSLLFNSGLPLPEIMMLASRSSGNKVISEALEEVHDDMVKGEGVSGPMAKNKLFLPMLVQMTKVGEESGSLDKTLVAVANSFETEAEDKMKSAIGLIQPAMTAAIGGVVGLVAVTLMSAMTKMYEGFG
ncbi:MAG: type II secretion system F family protein [Dehalococcoidales bacterium]|nr:type II secretion system F family protein [Dehalococcoidales bacterium]